MKEHEAFRLRRSRHQFARLMRLSEEQERQLEENPRPFLDRARRDLAKAQKALDDAMAVLRGLDKLQARAPFVSTQAVDRDRIKRALAIMDSVRR